MDWAASSGLMRGYAGSGLFGPDDALSREQLAAVLWRAAGGPDAGGFDPSAFPDGGEASEWAGPALAWAASTGVLEGSDDGEGRQGAALGSGGHARRDGRDGLAVPRGRVAPR